MENQLSSSGIFSQDLKTLQILQKIQRDLNVRQTNPEQFEGRILFMSMFNDIDWTQKGNSSDCLSNSEKIKKHATRFPRGHWSFLGPREENKWYGMHTYKPEGKWDEVADVAEKFKESGHSIFPFVCEPNKGILKRKWKLYDSLHCKSRPHAVLTSVKSKLRSPPPQVTMQTIGLSNPEAQAATWRTYDTMIQITFQKLWVSKFLEHWGNSRETANKSFEFSGQPFRRLYSNCRKEVDWCSCQWVLQGIHFGIQHLETGHEVGTPSSPKRTRNWRCTSMIGNRWVRRDDMRFRKKEDIPFLILIGSIVSGKEAINTISILARFLLGQCGAQ